ncbi:hypothetical protein [Pediococcus pentosaceus]|uniref:hypothetical protein n=1 Tax=Pediococcus pentosaceus TaxID=1255 RepID=UPI0013292CE1|nr:hypothetical protein [Pediococcus pentosaceus]KAF0502294.1 hypothetical protein GBP22_06965 [Pediococcus pentosaceus]
MLKEYRKTATIKAEQFDGSEEMFDKYDIRRDTILEKFEFCTPGRIYQLDVGDWIILDGYYVLSDEIFRKTYEEVE